MSNVKLLEETRIYICHKNMKSMGFFLKVFESFHRQINKKYIPQEMKNGLSLREQQLHVIM